MKTLRRRIGGCAWAGLVAGLLTMLATQHATAQLCPKDCGPDEYCQTAVGDCNGPGKCAFRPEFCPLFFDPVCGCNGVTYSNSCFAAAAGVNVAHTDPCCEGDINLSGDVDFDDVLAVLSAWGPYDLCPPFAPADLDEDCEVAFGDLLIVLSRWGPCPSAIPLP